MIPDVGSPVGIPAAIRANSSPGWLHGAGRDARSPNVRPSRTSFARTYTSADVRLLAHTDTLHGTLSGLATKKLMACAYGVFGDARLSWSICRSHDRSDASSVHREGSLRSRSASFMLCNRILAVLLNAVRSVRSSQATDRSTRSGCANGNFIS